MRASSVAAAVIALVACDDGHVPPSHSTSTDTPGTGPAIAPGQSPVVPAGPAPVQPEPVVPAGPAPVQPEPLVPAGPAPVQPEPDPGFVFGAYDLTTIVSTPLRQDSRGWEIEWQIPAFADVATDGAVGQWYWNLETGIYHTGDGWWIYYYGDDNGLTGNNPACNSIWLSGGACSGVFANLAPGRRVVFRYEYCDPSHAANVNGTRLCVSVDLKDGVGMRFLAEDTRTTDEMYAHDIENFRDGGAVPPIIPCTSPTKMVRQRRKTSAGTWVDMTGASSWHFGGDSGLYKFQNVNLSATPASWESCSGTAAAPTCSDGINNGQEEGVDCGGSCPACATGCLNGALTRVGAVALSQESATYSAAKAIDGSATTRWSSAFRDPQWIYVDLGAVRRVRRVTLNWEAAASANYDIDVATNSAGPWTLLFHTGSGNGGVDVIDNLSANVRYVRMYSRARTTPYGVSLWDFQVSGDPNPNCGP